jgi:hypothetical protein
MKDLIYKTLETVIAPDPSARRMTFTISTGSVDRDNDTLDPKGWDVKSYLTNPVVLFAHDYKSLPVAKCVEIKSTEHAWSQWRSSCRRASTRSPTRSTTC